MPPPRQPPPEEEEEAEQEEEELLLLRPPAAHRVSPTLSRATVVTCLLREPPPRVVFDRDTRPPRPATPAVPVAPVAPVAVNPPPPQQQRCIARDVRCGPGVHQCALAHTVRFTQECTFLTP